MSKILFDSKSFALQNSTVFFHLLFKGKRCPWASRFLIHIAGNLTDIIFFHWWFTFTNSPIDINVQFNFLSLKKEKEKKSLIFYPVSVEIPASKFGHTCTASTASTDCGVATTTHLECSDTAPTVCVCSTGYSGSPGGDCGGWHSFL